ncbi:hypothetical protein HA402_014584 [Bradysia odoriphaga]|nr:hypothetical protein HA402_014584 [Bradysia odoriphaga]
MKLILTVTAFFFAVGLTQSELIFRLELERLGFNVTNPGELWQTFTQKSDNCSEEAKIVMEFNIDTGDRQWSVVEFTAPIGITDATPNYQTNDTFIQSNITAVHDGPCQIDATVYLQPL